MKSIKLCLLLLIMSTILSCNKDDDNREPQMGFFPTKITINDSGMAIEIEFTYDNNNQIALISSDSFILNFTYNANGLISETRFNNGFTNGVYSMAYDGEILTSMTDQDGDVIPVRYTDETYSTNSAIIKLNPQNQVIEFYGSPLAYANNPGPFSYLKFQPALFISTDIVPLYCYFFSPNEITEVELPFDETRYTVVNQKDANNNIVFAQLVDQMGDDGLSYSVEYEERTLTN